MTWTNSGAFSPQANYTDRATATCWWNLTPTFADRRMSHDQCGGSPTVVNPIFLGRSRYYSFKQIFIYLHEPEWIPFQTHCYSENLVSPVIEPGPLGLQPGSLTTRPQRRSNMKRFNKFCTRSAVKASTVTQAIFADFPVRRPWYLWWTKRYWPRFRRSNSVSPTKHSTNCTTSVIIWGCYNRLFNGLSNSGLVPNTPKEIE
jgi:hypothetical protein